MNCSEGKIIIIGNGIKNSISDYLFKDVQNGRFQLAEYRYIFAPKRKIISLLHRVLYSRYISRLKFYDLIDWTKYYCINEETISENTIIVFNLASLYYRYINAKYIKQIKTRFPSVKLIWLLVDTIKEESTYYDTFNEMISLFDRCITFDPTDANKYSIEYRMLPYERSRELLKCLKRHEYTYDVYYVGRIKDRGRVLRGFLPHFQKHGIRAKLIEVSKKRERGKGIKRVGKPIPYREVLKDVAESNCILEIINSGSGASLRYYEAVLYNKKLLTNNENIKSLPYYDERYMRVFCKAQDVDYEWIKRVDNVNYAYDGLFSMESFLDFLRYA